MPTGRNSLRPLIVVVLLACCSLACTTIVTTPYKPSELVATQGAPTGVAYYLPFTPVKVVVTNIAEKEKEEAPKKPGAPCADKQKCPEPLKPKEGQAEGRAGDSVTGAMDRIEFEVLEPIADTGAVYVARETHWLALSM